MTRSRKIMLFNSESQIIKYRRLYYLNQKNSEVENNWIVLNFFYILILKYSILVGLYFLNIDSKVINFKTIISI